MKKTAKKIIKKSPLYRPLKFVNNRFNNFKMGRRAERGGETGEMRVPSGIVFEPTTKCNLDCEMCYQKEERALGKRDLSFEEVKDLIEKLKKENNLKHIGMIGAEVFMRRDIFDIISFCDEQKIKVYLATNGTLINENNIDKLKNLKNITGIGFSLDGDKDFHNRVRRRDYAYDNLLKAIRLTRDDFSLTVNSVIMNKNISYIKNIAGLCHDLRVPNYSLQFEVFSTSEEVSQSAEMLGIEEKDFAVEKKISDRYEFSLNDLEEIIKYIKSIEGLNVLVQPNVFFKNKKSYFEGNLREEERLFCKDVNVCRVNAQGEIIFCPFIKKSFGSLKDNSLEDIWNGDKMKNFRKKLLKNNLTPVCKRCCRLGAY